MKPVNRGPSSRSRLLRVIYGRALAGSFRLPSTHSGVPIVAEKTVYTSEYTSYMHSAVAGNVWRAGSFLPLGYAAVYSMLPQLIFICCSVLACTQESEV